MIEKTIEWSLRNRFLVICGALLLIALGIRAIRLTPVDAIPDLTENQVIVYADWMGRSPQEVEDQVTYPLSTGLQGLAGVKEVRATSMFGFSLITIIFEDKIDTYFARTRVLERLNYLQGSMPEGVTPQLGPDATGLGWVYQYYLHVDPAKAPDGGYDLAQLRSLQDWHIRYQLASVQGVAEVASIGGFVKQYQIELSSTKMRAANVTLMEVMTAVQNANLNVGGKIIEENGAEFVLRGIGLVTSPEDLELVTVKAVDGTPIYLKDIATVQIGGDFRRGALDVNGHEVVGGTVVMRTGENAKAVIERVKEKIAEIATSLPPGVTIRPFYDRSELIDRTIDTLKHALVRGNHPRHARPHHFPVALPQHPHRHAAAAGFDPDFVPADEGVRHHQQHHVAHRHRHRHRRAGGCGHRDDGKRHPPLRDRRRTKKAGRSPARKRGTPRWPPAKQVGRPIFFAMAIIILAFVPVFALTGQEGKLFHPLAFTKTFAMIGSTLLAVTLVPVLCSLLVRGPFHSRGQEHRDEVPAAASTIRRSNWALNHRKTVHRARPC